MAVPLLLVLPSGSGCDLGADPGSTLWPPPPTCAEVWLLQPPGTLRRDVWSVVCAAALEAMASGRRTLWALHKGQQVDSSQTHITDYFLPLEGDIQQPLNITQRASRKAAARFWCLLQDFVWLQQVPEGWEGVPSDHPFIGVEEVHGVPKLCLHLPVGLHLPAALD